MVRVTLEGLIKRYDRIAVVDGASMEIEAGSLAYLLGPSGAGKTTLARLVAGLEPADDGEIFFNERVIHKLPAPERRVGFVFQDDALWPRLTVAENVGYALKVRKMPRSERRDRVAETLSTLRIDAGPELLILDEPTGRLETRVRDEFRDEIRRIHAETELTTLVLTHDPREALALADKIAVMDLGRIIQSGPPHQVYNRPTDAFVARLLGPTNLLQGQVEGTDSRGEVVVRTTFGRIIGQGTSGPIPQGTPVTLAIRPEALGIGPNVPPGSNRFPATVERLVFFGEVRQVHLRGPGDWPIVALTLQSQSHALREGQSLTLSVPPEHVIVLFGKYAGPR
jgi:ABC-type Fe3+/spermidine/putrescine transport system ATPase subunit